MMAYICTWSRLGWGPEARVPPPRGTDEGSEGRHGLDDSGARNNRPAPSPQRCPRSNVLPVRLVQVPRHRTPLFHRQLPAPVRQAEAG